VNFIELIGWIGSVMLAVCAIPAAYSAWKEKSCNYNKLFLLLWIGGEVCLLIYVINTNQWLLLPNYILNTIAPSIIWRYNK